MSDLEQVLNGEVEEPEQPKTDESITASSDDSETKPTGEDVSPPETDTDLAKQLEDAQAEIQAFKSKAIDETGKRQTIEQQYQALQNQVTANQMNREKPDFWENPDDALSAVTQDVDRRLQQMNTNISVQIMRSLHDDYAEMEQKFVEDAQKQPALIAQMRQAENPAEFAYNYGKTQKQMTEFSNPDELRAKIKAELLAEMEAENKAKIEQEISKVTELPGSLSTERAAAATSSYATPDLEKLIG